MGISAAIGEVVGSTIGGDIIGGALVGAAISGVTGGNMLTGALTGGIGGGLIGSMGSGFGAAADTTGSLVTGGAALDSFGMQVTPGILSGAGTGMTTAGVTGALGDFAPNLLTNTAGLGVDSAGASLAGSMSGSGLFGNTFAGGYNPNSLFNKITNPLSNVTGGSGQKSSAGNLASLVGAGMNVYSAMNAQKPQDPNAAQQGANPWAPYAPQSAQQLNALNQNPYLAYSAPGYQAQQQQAQQQVGRTGAAAGASASGGTLAALNQQAQLTASDFFNTRVSQLSQMAGATPQNMVAGQNAYNQAQLNQSISSANQANLFASGLAGLGQSFFA
jgi:hypothetical protein